MYLSYRNLPQINPIKTKKNLNSVNNNFLFKSFFHLSSHIDKYHPVFFRDNRVKEKVIFARFIISAFVTYSDLSSFAIPRKESSTTHLREKNVGHLVGDPFINISTLSRAIWIYFCISSQLIDISG